MSQENVETLQRARAAWDADDLDAFLAEADPEVEWNTAVEEAAVGRQNTYRRHDVCERPGTSFAVSVGRDHGR
jgi:hypothetical protein